MIIKNKFTTTKIIILIAFFGFLLLIPIGIFAGYVTAKTPFQNTSASNNGYPGPGTPASVTTPTASTSLPPEVQEIMLYKEWLKSGNLSDEMRNSLQTKIEILSRVATQKALVKESSKVPPLFTPRTLPTSTFETGLLEGGTSDFHAWEADIKNIWRQYGNNNEYVIVYAGELGSETDFPGRGVVFVRRIAAGDNGSSLTRYLLPEGTGWVRISEVKGNYIILTSEDGKTFYFYLPAQQFVNNLISTAPTVTPIPTFKPSPLRLGPPPTVTPPYP